MYLACVVAVLGLSAWTFFTMMQPTVIPNAGLAKYKAPGPTVVLFSYKVDPSVEAMERLAIAAAKQDNQDQGIQPFKAFAAVEPAAGNSPSAEALAKAKPKQAARKRPPPQQQAPADPWQSWRFAQRDNGWFGSGNGRPFWGGRRDWN
jgi:hypothetical protein